MSTLTDEERAERRAHSRRATERARAIVKPGDMLTFTRCGGHSRGRFTGWDGWWMCSPTRSDISALCVFKLNGAWVTFADEGHWDPHLGDPRRDLDVMSFDPFFPDETDTTLLSDTMGLASKWHDCAICGGRIWGGERIRRRVERINEGRPRVMTFRFCPLCCQAMAASWTDDGKAITERTALGVKRSQTVAEGSA
ncbi:hypothetical protein KHC23_07670 [Ancylobacter dichloromethanicus]|uniref:Uncharacterized protein n=1 Tax=Ancylobacter dichloromethanicus TaxID=518825 RepID=A0A9W6N028_9HYPH|nr:hypothetical protein [Ancylobacter dichloromethanicus]MBS7553524.1 hypothetical protein [Ancylobacter dichloromethanicus]GLK72582.1 hypothetical protein GCM10017643_26980 [Ancylobacter dichloromethanicus]